MLSRSRMAVTLTVRLGRLTVVVVVRMARPDMRKGL